MPTTRLIRFNATFYDAGEPKFEAGKLYPVSEETERHVAVGIAEPVDVDLDADKAEKLAAKARQAADRAIAAAAEAEKLADAAREAQRLADEAAAALAVTGESAPAPESVQTPAPADVPEVIAPVELPFDAPPAGETASSDAPVTGE